MENDANLESENKDHSIALRLKLKKEKVLNHWEERVRQAIPAARQEAHPIVIDTFPLIIDLLIDALSPSVKTRSIASEGVTACQEHGGERARLTAYTLEGVLKEYQILRDVIFEVLLEEGPISERDRTIIYLSIDDVMKQSAIAFSLVQSAIREQFVMTLSHDIRGPLAAAQLHAEIIYRNPNFRESGVSKLVYKVIQNIERIDKMITNLLDISRVRAGERLSLEISEGDVTSIVYEVTNELENIHKARFEIHEKHAIGFWDLGALRRVIENLCSNAVKYGDNSLAITINISQAHGRTLIAVHNHGKPIPAEEQETLFEAYRRAKSVESSKIKGWGLGLALVRSVTEAHGGSVMIDSAPERGTTFIIDIPTDSRPYIQKAKQPFAA